MDGTILLLIIVCVIVIWIAYLLAEEFYKVAEYKGFSERKYFWIALLFGLAGYFLIIALPDRGNMQQMENDELPDL